MGDSAASDPLEVWRGAAPADVGMGWIAARTSEGLMGLAAALGMAGAFGPHATSTLILREQHVSLAGPPAPGTPLVLTAGVVELGADDAVTRFRLRAAAEAVPCAEALVRIAHAARDGRVFPWPQRTADTARALAVRSDGTGGALEFEPLGEQSLARGGVGAHEADAFGRLRAELTVARIAEAHLQLGDGAPARLSLIHLGAPSVGDLYELRSRATGGGLVRHRLVDPLTGGAWARAETA